MFENKNIEYKREYTDGLKYAVVAFANTDGGKIYIGLNDDGTVLGVENIDDTMLKVSNMIRDAIRPDVTLFVDFKIETIEEKTILVVMIQRGTSRPYYLHSKGVRPEGVYIRQGASSVPASETAILNMIKETSGDCYENARALNQQLTFEKTAAYFKKKTIEFGEIQKRSLNIISQDNTYSNLGMLLSDQCIHSIKIAVFDGSTKSTFRDRTELTGSLLEQLESAYAYIKQFNRTHSDFEDLDRIDTRDYPPEAIRESLLNAIIHRDYSIKAPTLISIFDDRIEFVTIGGLVRGIAFEDIMMGVSALRNEHLANVFYRLRLIEAYGTGLLKINESYLDFDVKPKIEVTTNAFKITLPNVNFKPLVQPTLKINSIPFGYGISREDIILSTLTQKQTITRKEVEKLLNVSQPTAVLILRDMVNKGLLERIGEGKSTQYISKT